MASRRASRISDPVFQIERYRNLSVSAIQLGQRGEVLVKQRAAVATIFFGRRAGGSGYDLAIALRSLSQPRSTATTAANVRTTPAGSTN
jgi:hypothetical protein